MKNHHKKQMQEKNANLGLHDQPVARFETDILAAHDFGRLHRSRPLSPERDLMLAILEQAINDYQRCFSARDKKGRECFADTRAWIMNADSEWIFSFINCCEVLGIAPDYLRHGLVRLKQGKRPGPLSARAKQHQKHQPKRMRQAA